MVAEKDHGKRFTATFPCWHDFAHAQRAAWSLARPYTDLPANMPSETGFPSSRQLKFYVASKSRLKLAARVVVSADAGLLVAINMENYF